MTFNDFYIAFIYTFDAKLWIDLNQSEAYNIILVSVAAGSTPSLTCSKKSNCCKLEWKLICKHVDILCRCHNCSVSKSLAITKNNTYTGFKHVSHH